MFTGTHIYTVHYKQTQKSLVEHELKESLFQTQLLNIRVKRAQGDVEHADLGVSKVRSVLHENSFSVYTEGHLELGSEGSSSLFGLH